jgi:hypothetical protein
VFRGTGPCQPNRHILHTRNIGYCQYTKYAVYDNAMARPEEFPIKIQLGLSEDLEAQINAWRRTQDDMPNRSEAIRRLITQALQRAPRK